MACGLRFSHCSYPDQPCSVAGHLLSRVVRKWKSKVQLRGWPHKVRGQLSRRQPVSSHWVLRLSVSRGAGQTTDACLSQQ
jgi:hypothetical protein